VGLLQRLRERIDPPQEPDPDEWVVVAVVPVAEGPLVQSAIEGAGIDAVMYWGRAFAGRGADFQRIAVRRRDQAEAEQIVRDERGPNPGNGPFIWRW
jgi:hypothetical protein